MWSFPAGWKHETIRVTSDSRGGINTDTGFIFPSICCWQQVICCRKRTAPVNDHFKMSAHVYVGRVVDHCPVCLNSCLFPAITDGYCLRFTERKRKKKLNLVVITIRNISVKTFALTNQEFHHWYFHLLSSPLTVLYTQFGYSAASLIEWRLMALDEWWMLGEDDGGVWVSAD